MTHRSSVEPVRPPSPGRSLFASTTGAPPAIGRFRWREWEVEVDRSGGSLSAPTHWLFRIAGTSRTHVATLRQGKLTSSGHESLDEVDLVELHGALNRFLEAGRKL